MPMSFNEISASGAAASAARAIQSLLPLNVDQPELTVNRVTMGGKPVFRRSETHA